MANIKLGAIITDIAGSVGGSTFRRTQAGIVLYNKQGRQIKSAFSKFSRKNAIAQIFRAWGDLPPGEREQWAVNASLYPIKNKFGEDKILSARELYTKLNTQLLPVQSFSDVANFSTILFAPVVYFNVLDISSETFILSWDGTASQSYLLVSMYQIRKNGSAKPTKAFRRTFWENGPGNGPIDIYYSVIEQFPFLKAGDTFGVNVQWMNQSGIISSVQSTTVEAQP
jgi:hypothetical protein